MKRRTTKVEVPIPDVHDLDLITPGAESFEEVLLRRQKAKDQMNKLKVTIAECDMQLGTTLDLAEVKSVSCREYVVSRREASAPRKKINPTKLIELGVSPVTIMQATEVGSPGRLGIVVRKVGESEEEDPIDGNW